MMCRSKNSIDRTKGVLDNNTCLNGGAVHVEGGMVMRKVVTVLLALGLLLGVAGSALANCGANHTDAAQPTTGKPLPQT
jgi:hypothetical protein